RRCGRPTKLALELHAIPIPGIMAGSHHHTTRGTLLFHGVRNGRSRRIVIRKLDRNAGIGNYVGNKTGESRRSEARIVSDDHTTLAVFVLQDIRSNRTRNAPYVVKGKVVGNHATPAISTELYVRHILGRAMRNRESSIAREYSS